MPVLVRSANAEELIEPLFLRNPDGRASLIRPSFRALYATMLWDRGETTEANILFDKALQSIEDLLAEGNELPSLPLEAASIHALRGQRQSALEWLERAYQTGWRDYRTLARDVSFESVREEPRFGELLGQMETDVSQMRRRARERGLLDLDYPQ